MKYLSYNGSYGAASEQLLTSLGFVKYSSDATYNYYHYGTIPFRDGINDSTFQINFDGSYYADAICISKSSALAQCYYYRSTDGSILYLSCSSSGNTGILIMKTEEGYCALGDFYSSDYHPAVTYLTNGTFEISSANRLILGSTSAPSIDNTQILVTPMVLTKVSTNTKLQLVSGVYCLYTSVANGTAFSIGDITLQKVFAGTGTVSYNKPFGIPYVTD